MSDILVAEMVRTSENDLLYLRGVQTTVQLLAAYLPAFQNTGMPLLPDRSRVIMMI